MSSSHSRVPSDEAHPPSHPTSSTSSADLFRPVITRSDSASSSVFSHSASSSRQFWASNRSSIGGLSYLTTATSHEGGSQDGGDDECRGGSGTRPATTQYAAAVEHGTQQDAEEEDIAALVAALDRQVALDNPSPPSLSSSAVPSSARSTTSVFSLPKITTGGGNGTKKRTSTSTSDRRNINRSLKVSGLPISPSTPVFPLRSHNSAPSLFALSTSNKKSPSPRTSPFLSPFAGGGRLSLPPTFTRAAASTSALPSSTLHSFSSAPPSPPPCPSTPSSLDLTPVETSTPGAGAGFFTAGPSPASPAPPVTPSGSATLAVPPTPYRQRLRFPGDLFTPEWVRGSGEEKEGWCGLCAAAEEEAEGAEVDESERVGDLRRRRWFNFRSGAYWFHVTLLHGVSSQTGAYFDPPLETRASSSLSPSSTGNQIEGLCGTCHTWQPFSSSASLAPAASTSLKTPSRSHWYFHAHTCHSAPSSGRGGVRRIAREGAAGLDVGGGAGLSG
ncbi:hypothetical protein JCM6882_002195 [Rhodosporidiobolus microsporus]